MTAQQTQTQQIQQMAADYEFDLAHSSADFSVKHLMIATVRGRMSLRGGHVHVDAAHPERSRIVAELEAGSIETGQKDRDAHLRSADFLDAEQHPTLRFESTRVEKLSDETWRVTGDLAIRGVAHPITIDVDYEGQAKDPWGRVHAALTGRAVVDRTLWGLTWNQALETGGVLVGDKVKVELHVQLIAK